VAFEKDRNVHRKVAYLLMTGRIMECLADCGEGPVVMVDEQTYENVDEKKAEKLADLLLKGKLEQSKEFVSYEQGLVSAPVSKSKKATSRSKK
jgi:(2Fe-2S) ferredoxin